MSDDLTLDDLPQPLEETTVHPEELTVDGDNPNDMPDDLFEALTERIEERGWVGNSIVVDADGCIADGEHRWLAAQDLGLVEVPIKRYPLADAERRLVRQELNKLSGEHDPAADSSEYELILDSVYGDDLDAFLDAAEPDTDLDTLLEDVSLDGDDMADAFGDVPDGERDPIRQKTFTLSAHQVEIVDQALDEAKEQGDFPDGPNENSNGNALARVCRQYTGDA